MSRASCYSAGFSLIESLLAVAIVALVATVVVPSIQGGPEAAKKAKLEQDVVVVNNAIDAYLTAGGSQAALSAGGVIEALKQQVTGGVAAEMTGPMGPFLDPRIVTNSSDFSWSARFDQSGTRPRFVVQKSPDGVVFALGPASAVGGAVASSKPSWLWSYTPATATDSNRPVFEPGTIDVTTTLGATNAIINGLSAPVITPASQTLPISGFPLLVSISNPNPANSSIVYYRIGSGSWVLWVGSPFNVDPGSVVTAVSISIDPSRYYNSPASSQTYGVTPLQLTVGVSAPGSVTYAQAGGQMVGQAVQTPVTASVSLANAASIPAPYLSSSYFTLRYTTDGSDPRTSGTAQTGPSFNGSVSAVQIPLGLGVWGSLSSMTIRAAAVSSKTDWFTTSSVGSTTSTRALTALTLGVLPANPIGLPVTVQINESGLVPTGLRKFYSVTGTAPLSSASGGSPVAGATLYTAPIAAANLPSATYTLIGQATGPAGYEAWFSSAPVTRNYRTVSSLPSQFVGANISGGDVNGTFTGSIFVAAPATLGIFNAGGTITGGNLYVPGLPGIEIPGSGTSTKIVVNQGQPYVEQGQIPRDLVGGKEFTADGQLADPQLDTRQVVDLNGAVTPTNYTVKLTKSAYIEGKIYRRSDAPAPPAVPTVPAGLTSYTNGISGVFQTNIPPGIYSNVITMNATNSVLRLGTAGSSITAQYIFTQNTWNKGRVEVLGPVEIFFLNGFDNKGVTFGSSNNIVTNSAASLRINVMTNAVDLTGGATVYASLWAGNSAVTVGNGSFFYGSIYATTLTVSPGGTVNVK